MRRSHLSQYKQNKFIELFVAGVTARTAAQLVGVTKIPQLIISTGCGCLYFTAVRIWKCLTVKQKQMKATLAVIVKVSGVTVRQGRSPYSGF